MTWEDDFMCLTGSNFSEMRLLVEGAIRLFEDDASVLCRLARDAEKHEAMSALPFAELTITPERLVFRLLQGDAVLPYATKTWAEGVFTTTSERCITSGGWEGEGRFRVICEVKDDFICNMELIVSMCGDRAALCLNGRLLELAPGWNSLAWGVCLT